MHDASFEDRPQNLMHYSSTNAYPRKILWKSFRNFN